MKLKTIFFNYFVFLFFIVAMLSCGTKTKFLLHESSLTIDESPWGVEFNAFPPHLNKFSYDLSTITEEKIDMLINKTCDLGVKWVRLSIDWQNVVDTLGTYDWERLDKIIEGLSAKKIEIVLCINGGHKLYTKGNAPATLPEIILWKEFASNLVKRYKDRVKSWELWNEPNTVWFWKPKPVAQQYVTLMGEFYSLLKEIDPMAKIAGGEKARLDI
jgi:endo-1,4-beta-mannosidase